MQHICFEACGDIASVEREICRMVEEGCISKAYAEAADAAMIWAFLSTEMGQRLKKSPNILREFKFSILEHGEQYDPDLKEDRILLQGVVDCAIIDEDGITVLDFKTDRVTEETLMQTADSYRMQVKTYAQALSKIFGKKVISAQLYFFRMNQFVTVI